MQQVHFLVTLETWLSLTTLCVCLGMDLIDPKELESMRHQVEDAQRWNASLQARLAIQNRGGGVGGANDGGKSRKIILDVFFGR